jgi:hypothetical protein
MHIIVFMFQQNPQVINVLKYGPCYTHLLCIRVKFWNALLIYPPGLPGLHTPGLHTPGLHTRVTHTRVTHTTAFNSVTFFADLGYTHLG